jgi:uncharacterized iron-regulated membrane protein
MGIGFKITRRFWLLLHRYAGLAMAFFLVVAGLTGTVIVFYEEIDHFFYPHLFRVARVLKTISPLDLRKRAEEVEPRARVDSVALNRPPEVASIFYLQPRIDPATGRPHALEFDEIFLDPHTGDVLGKRNSQEGILPFIYRLHYTLALPEPWGRWLLGVTALIWTLECFVGFYLTLPARHRHFWSTWRPAWRVKWTHSAYRINFDLHRASGLWTWLMLLVLAISSVQYNLRDEVFRPLLASLFTVDDPFDRAPALPKPLGEPGLTWEQALERGRALMKVHADAKGFTILYEDNLSLDRAHGLFVYSVKSQLDIRDRIGDTRFFFSAIDGRDLGFTHPYAAAGNVISQWLGALHTGRVGGFPYRVLLCLMGAVTSMLTITGLVIWWRRRKGRVRAVTLRTRQIASGRGS